MAWLRENGEIFTDDEIGDLFGNWKRSPLEFLEILASEIVCKIPEQNQCREFLRDFRGTVYRDCNRENVDSWRETEIAERMHIPVAVASVWTVAIIAWGLSERQGGGLVI